jgi:hypothetical protein
LAISQSRQARKEGPMKKYHFAGQTKHATFAFSAILPENSILNFSHRPTHPCEN